MATVTSQVSRIRTRFKKDPNARVINDTTILNFLNEAQDMVEAEVIVPNMQTSGLISLTADTQEYSVGSDVFKILLVRYQTNDWVLKEQSMLSIQKRFDDATGTPQEYYVFGGQIGFYPVPSTTESNAIKYWYVKTLPELVESGAGSGQVTTSELPENFHWVLERGAEMLMFQMVGAYNRAQQAEMKFREGIELLKERYSTMTDNYDSELYTEDDMVGTRTFRFDPYQ